MKKLKKDLLLTLSIGLNAEDAEEKQPLSYKLLYTLLAYSSSSIRQVISEWVAMGIVTATQEQFGLGFQLSRRGRELAYAQFPALFATAGPVEPEAMTICIYTGKASHPTFREVKQIIVGWGVEIRTGVWVGPKCSIEQKKALLLHNDILLLEHAIPAIDISRVSGKLEKSVNPLRRYSKNISTELAALKQMKETKYIRPRSAVKKYTSLLHLFTTISAEIGLTQDVILPHFDQVSSSFAEYAHCSRALFAHLLLQSKR